MKPRYDLLIDALDSRGAGIGRGPKGPVTVPAALPGDRVRARQVSRPGRSLKAVAESWDALSIQRRVPPCRLADRCGACAWMGARDAAQIEWKLATARRVLAGVASVSHIVPAPASLGYRNRAILPFGKRPPAGRAQRVAAPVEVGSAARPESPWERSRAPLGHPRSAAPRPSAYLGYYEPGTHHLVDVAACAVLLPSLNAALAVVRRAIAAVRPVPFNEATGHGVLRRVALRGAARGSDVLITVVVADASAAEPLLVELAAGLPPAAPLALNIQRESGNAVFGAETHVVQGRPFIEERIRGHCVRLDATAFFQLNTAQAEALYARVAALAGAVGGQSVADLYGGVGLMGLDLARAGAARVSVVESAPSALAEARRLAAAQPNLQVVAGDVASTLPTLGPLDLVITDPPRAGLGEAAAAALVKTAPRRIIHIACSLNSLARDLRRLLAGPYRLVGPVELFDFLPQTPHVEALALLERV